MAPLSINAASPDPHLMNLPWDRPLEKWPQRLQVDLPRGISRHTVRFVQVGDTVVAIKETPAPIAWREYETLTALRKLGPPMVEPYAVVTGRTTSNGEELLACLVTKHLEFSLPYRALFSGQVDPAQSDRLIDALAVLLVRLHLLGFFWGDVSLSNTLFRHDASAFAAYLVDAETGEMYDSLTDGQRGHDLELARVNIIGELMDLQAGGMIDDDIDVIEIGNKIAESYTNLWEELTGEETIGLDERWKLAARIDRLADLGFDIAEMTMVHDAGKEAFVIRPKVVDAGHNERQFKELTGMTVQEAQAKRLIADMRTFASLHGLPPKLTSDTARQWLAEEFHPTVNLIPANLRHKLQPAQLFHEIMEHRWYLSEAEGEDVGAEHAAQSYLYDVLFKRGDGLF